MKGNREDALERDLSALYRSDRELFLRDVYKRQAGYDALCLERRQ